MRKIAKRFDQIWEKAQRRNEELDPLCAYSDYAGGRFQKIWDVNEQTQPKHQKPGKQPARRYVTMGIYDTYTHKYTVFNTINLVGNFRYNPQHIPAELNEMDRLVSQ